MKKRRLADTGKLMTFSRKDWVGLPRTKPVRVSPERLKQMAVGQERLARGYRLGISACYDGGLNVFMDALIYSLAGYSDGSGCMLRGKRTRDHAWELRDPRSAFLIAHALSHLKGVRIEVFLEAPLPRRPLKKTARWRRLKRKFPRIHRWRPHPLPAPLRRLLAGPREWLTVAE